MSVDEVAPIIEIEWLDDDPGLENLDGYVIKTVRAIVKLNDKIFLEVVDENGINTEIVFRQILGKLGYTIQDLF